MDELLGTEVRRLRNAAGLSQQRLATRVGVDQALISKIETGAKVPSTALVRTIDDVLAADGHLVAMRLSSERASTGTVGAERPIHEEIVVMAARRARDFALNHQVALSDEAMDQVYDDVRSLAVAYPQQPLPSLLGPLAEAQEEVFSLLEYRRRPRQARQLYFLAGVTAGLLAKASHDLAAPHPAMTHARTAFLCADNADHDALRGWVRGLQSLISYWAGRHHDSLRYAQSGAGFLSAARGTVAVWLPASEGRAWAAIGNAEETHAAIDRAERARNGIQADDLDEIGGLCEFSRARQLYYAADALSWLPQEAATAENYSAAAVEAYRDPSRPEWAFGDQAGSHAGLAHVRIARGELDGAIDALAPVLHLAPERRINGIVHSVQRVHDTLARLPLALDPAAQDLRKEIEAFARTPTAALPR